MLQHDRERDRLDDSVRVGLVNHRNSKAEATVHPETRRHHHVMTETGDE